jgi:hypothetical protein
LSFSIDINSLSLNDLLSAKIAGTGIIISPELLLLDLAKTSLK